MKYLTIAGLLPLMVLMLSSTGFSITISKKGFDCKGRVERCEKKKDVSRRPVCGTDNISYPSRCALLRVRCFSDPLLRVKHRGRCKEKQPCWVDQSSKTVDPSTTQDSYMPRCKADGTYFRIQCHKKEGYCWCVTPAGKVIQNTIVRGEKPKCDDDRGQGRKGSSKNGSNFRKECSQIDKISFVGNIIRIFRTEYNREQYRALLSAKDRSPYMDPVKFDKIAVDWKFGALDRDKNGSLNKMEFRDLKKLIRKVIRPKRCSRAFIRMCDLDHNGALSKPEWLQCFLIDAEPVNKKTTTSTSTSTTTTTTARPPPPTTEDYEDKDGGIGLEDPEDVLHEGVATINGILPGLMAENDQEEESELNDCLADRQEALDDSSTSSHKYIPECTTDGRYKRVQCYKSVGYCWCAQEDTGKPIPGTSVKDSNPKCDGVSLLSRPMKGCPEHKKTIFLKDLMNHLKLKYSKNGTSVSNDYESIISDIFHSLDANRNRVLERKEWKSFRGEMMAESKLRRCGRKLPRYCDANRDNRIGFTEWLNCLNVNHVQAQTQHNETNTTIIAKRRGPNPLESYLKGDDDEDFD